MKCLCKIMHLSVLSAVVVILLTAQGCVQPIEFSEEMQVRILVTEANNAYLTGNYRTALRKCEDALQASKNVVDPQQLQYLTNDLVKTCEKLSQHEELPPMSKELAHLLAGAQTENAKKEKADTLLQEARESAKRGAFQEAFNKLEEAQDIYETMEEGSAKEEVDVEMALTVVMHDLTLEEETLVELEQRLLALIERIDTEDRSVANWLASLGRAHEEIRQYEEALRYYQQVHAMKQALGDERVEQFGVYHFGRLYEKLGQYEKALELYQQARIQKKEAGDPKGEVEALYKIVDAYKQIPQYETALEVEQEILAIQRASGSPADVALALFRIASLYNLLQQYENALNAYREALARYQELEGPVAQHDAAQIMQFIGFIYRELGEYEKAIALQEQALTLWTQAEADMMLYHAHQLEARYGDRLESMGLQDQLAEYYRQAEAARAGKGKVIQYPLIELAKSYQMAGQSGKAEGILLQTLTIVRENAEFILVPLQKELEQAKELAETSESAKEQAERLEDNFSAQMIHKNLDEAYVLDEIGTFYKNREQYEKSLEFYQQALALYREFQTLVLRIYEDDVLEHIGTVYVALEQYEKALEFYQEALAICRELNQNRNLGQDLWIEERLLDSIGVAYEKLGQYEQAVAFHRQALEMAEEIRVPERIWHNNHAMGRSLAKWGKHDKALQHYERAIDTIESVRAGLKEKEHKSAFMREQLYIYDELIDWLHTLHQKYPDQGYDRKALEIFERKQGRVFLEEMGQSGARFFARLPEAIAQRERDLRSQIPQTRKQLVDERAKPVAEQIRAYIRNLEQREKNLLAEQEALQNTIKTDYPDYYALQYPKPATLSDIQTSVLQSGELILVYSVMEANTFLWVIGQNEFELYALDIDEETLAAKIAELRQALQYDWSTERGFTFAGQDVSKQDVSKQAKQKPVSFARASYELYTTLIPEAVRSLLNDQHTLNIIPTGPLYALPFEALITRPAKDPRHARYLIEDIPISYLSSASLLNTLRKSQAQRTTTAPYPLLAFADPAYSSETPEETDSVRALRNRSYRNFLGGSFTELPETADEAKAIAGLFNAPQESAPLQLRENASYASVIDFNSGERLDDYQYLIFAMHGVLPGEVDHVTQSALVLSDNYLTAADVFGLQLNAKIVSLSACNTGRGTQVKGEGVRGLTRAFMYAGTPAVAVTLWSVESLSAKDLDIGFFRHLKTGLPPVRALQAIKVQMLRGEASGNYRHPYYWAPFVIFGDGM